MLARNGNRPAFMTDWANLTSSPGWTGSGVGLVMRYSPGCVGNGKSQALPAGGEFHELRDPGGEARLVRDTHEDHVLLDGERTPGEADERLARAGVLRVRGLRQQFARLQRRH